MLSFAWAIAFGIALLVLIEGTVVMDALGHGAMADTAADWLDR